MRFLWPVVLQMSVDEYTRNIRGLTDLCLENLKTDRLTRELKILLKFCMYL